MKILSRARDIEQLFRVSNILDIDEIMELTAEDGKGFDEGQSGVLVRENIKGIKEDNKELFDNIELNTDVDVIIANARSKNLSQSDSDLLDVMQFYTDENEVMNMSKKLGLKIDKDMAAKFADRNLKLLLQKEEELIAAIRQATDLKDVFNSCSKLEICFARHNTNWRHDPEIELSKHEQEVQLIRQLLFCCTAVRDVLELAEKLNIPFDEQRALELLNEIDEGPKLLHKMLNHEITITYGFYKELIERMEDDPEYQSYKGKTFKSSREMIEFYFPNKEVMYQDLIYGQDNAEFAYATMFLHGIIVEYDLDKALYWLKRAYHDNNKEAFKLIRKLMEENGRNDEFEEFCIECALLYNDSEVIECCKERGFDFTKIHPKQQKLIDEYLSFYNRLKRNTTKRDRELIDLILAAKSEDETLRWIKELEPMADERLAKMFYHAKPYSVENSFQDKICDETDPLKKQALMDEYNLDKYEQKAYWTCEKDLILDDLEKKFVSRQIKDFSYRDNMESDSPRISQNKRRMKYSEMSEIDKAMYRMLDDDHRLSYESAVVIRYTLSEIEKRNQQKRHQKIKASTNNDIVFYDGPYYKRFAIFYKFNNPLESRTVEEMMYDHMLHNILCETVVNALFPADIGLAMVFEKLSEKELEIQIDPTSDTKPLPLELYVEKMMAECPNLSRRQVEKDVKKAIKEEYEELLALDKGDTVKEPVSYNNEVLDEKELSRQQGMELIRKMRQSTDVNEFVEIAQQLGLDFGKQLDKNDTETTPQIKKEYEAMLTLEKGYSVNGCTTSDKALPDEDNFLSKQGMELIRKLRQSTNEDEILDIAQQLGLDFSKQSAKNYAEMNRKIVALDEPK
ncbi:SEL1-like repeat protein [Anaerovibrio lipolyticus]|uniref:SEL1-like repeat protein n=1 Tax=Anaerovibrio lipolyticus TaxID=82374 RepID=UPI00055CF647|nr:SEL1-like repeat protein [Anaerovibrio lipolyticus]